MRWITVCPVDDIDPEDLAPFDHAGQSYAIYRDEDGAVFATDGLCTHEHVHLCNGLVMGSQIECPKHNGRFNYKTGAAERLPCVRDLKTHPVRVVDGMVEIGMED
ncbi:MocE family 2Fe-2S type ferredoxin [Tabrizicola oligotrophica]|uniref:Rieske 2Fe-2S domain-containing protein n=1 Tax=Tabrizicola oligotrophica TaxID=2710650 RepID=A0A6M0QWG0_9RHOB|nr:MocE family 2Fe-2S type ferredoxin [Tabrizicola oligotrophica]NEY91816.1 Rieske 2Fe-2S domain-containing protein [Tabrizicola oligotrophica]